MNKPRLGQHFLIAASFLKPILQAADLQPGDAVIEVGPGKGMLTRALVKVAARVLALEVDERLVMGLRAKFAGTENLIIRKADARRVDWSGLVKELQDLGCQQVKLVANLPYYLASQMVIHALAASLGCSRLVIMVQDEVAQRICALPGTKRYSAYSIAVQYYGAPRYVVKVPPQAFRPAPRVYSAVVSIDRRLEPLIVVPDPDRFFYLVHAMFTHRRKMLRNCLYGIAGTPSLLVWEAALEKAGLDYHRRPETLTMDELALLMRTLDQNEKSKMV